MGLFSSFVFSSALALEKGFKLSEYGLYMMGDTGVPGDPLPISSEQDVFEILGVPYRSPEQRSL
jgi:DNA polymerase beta